MSGYNASAYHFHRHQLLIERYTLAAQEASERFETVYDDPQATTATVDFFLWEYERALLQLGWAIQSKLDEFYESRWEWIPARYSPVKRHEKGRAA